MARPIAELSHRQPDELSGPLSGIEPGVIRGLADHWQVVAAARGGERALLDYLRSIGEAATVEFAEAPATEAGRFHYSPDLKGFNFRRADP
jgi:hypothetical protein